MDREVFEARLRQAETMHRLTADPLEVARIEGYMRGLRREHHGESFGTEQEHALWLDLLGDVDPLRDARGRGYRLGIAEASGRCGMRPGSATPWNATPETERYRVIDGHPAPYSLTVQQRGKDGDYTSPKRLTGAAYMFAREWLAEHKPAMHPVRIEGAYLFYGTAEQAAEAVVDDGELQDSRVRVTDDVARGSMLWGPGPLPEGAELLGVVARPGEALGGALLLMTTGIYVQGNAGAIRTLPQREVRDAVMSMAHPEVSL